MPLENLTRDRIVQALNLLGELAEKEGVVLEVCIYGGTAMMLAYGARDRTKDVDAIIRPSDIARRLGAEVAQKLSLHENWLNDEVRRFISDAGTFAPLEIEALEAGAKRHLKITRPSASYLLAMKCMSCRPPLPGYKGDVDDIEFLMRKMDIRSVAQVEEHLERFYPYDGLSSVAEEVVTGIIPKLGEKPK
jgi:hypothetical protein